MQPPQDYYSILGVPRDASAADIRRAFRALAKSLHPDSQKSDAGPRAEYDFSTISEAYETLKDDDKRAAYDDELLLSRQLAAREAGAKKRPAAFMAGLGIGLAIAVGAIAFKVYSDRMDGRAELQKTQDSLNPRKKTASAAQSERLSPRTEDRQESVEATPSTKTAEPDSDADAKAGEEEIEATTGTQSKPALPEKGPNETPAATTTSVERTPPPPAQTETRQPSGVAASQSVAVSVGLKDEILALEHLLDQGDDKNAAQRLTSLVASSVKIEELSRAAAVASKPETIDLINKRISLLMKSQNGRPGTSGDVANAAGAPLAAAAMPSVRPSSGNPVEAEFTPAPDGSIQIVVGPRRDERTLRIKPGNGLAEAFADCPFCPEMVVAPAGQFSMGSKPEDDGHRVEEGPAHRVVIQRPFAISKHGITNENWRACILGGGCRAAQFSSFLANPDIPASRLSWFDAKGYVDWLSHETGKTYRLLTEAEWEYVARAGGKRGSPPSAERPDHGRFEPVNFADILPLRTRMRPGSGYIPNPWGLYDMRGTAMEWVEDCWHPTYNHAPADASPWLSTGAGDCSHRMVRGGFIGADWARQRVTTRAREFADMRAPGLGFRVARDLTPAAAKVVLEKQ